MKQGLLHGYSKIWLPNANIFIGDLDLLILHKGKLYKIQPDNTYNLYSVTYDSESDREKGESPDS